MRKSIIQGYTCESIKTISHLLPLKHVTLFLMYAHLQHIRALCDAIRRINRHLTGLAEICTVCRHKECVNVLTQRVNSQCT